tara:strand:- start:886 stop:1140 length:255 start_codon:yes stop_codon:yes gene_type:complete
MVQNLKAKRSISQRIIRRIRDAFPVSVSEVDHQDLWQRLTLGIACVGSEAKITNDVIVQVIKFMDKFRGDTELLDWEKEIIKGI